MPKHYHVAYELIPSARVAAGMRKLGEICTLGHHSDARVNIPVKDKARIIFQDVLTRAQIGDFAKGTLLISGTTYHLNRRSKEPLPDGPLLVIYPQESEWWSLLRDNTVTDIIFVPWLEKDLKTYLMGHHGSELVAEIGQARADLSPPTSSESVTKAADELGTSDSPADPVSDSMKHAGQEAAPEIPEQQFSEAPLPAGTISFKKLTKATREWRVALSGSYGETTTAIDFSARPKQFERFADALLTFPPRAREHRISLVAGAGFGGWDHHVQLHAGTHDSGEHYLEVYTDNVKNGPESRHIRYSMSCTASCLQRFGALILAWLEDPKLPLEWTVEPGCPKRERQRIAAENVLREKYGLE